MGDSLERLYEQTIALRCQARDREAFEELVNRYHDRLSYYVANMICSADVEDVMQDLWIEVYRSLPGLRDVRALRAWLYRIAHTRAVRIARIAGVTVPLDQSKDQELDADDGGLSADEVAHLHAALELVSREHREVLLLRFFEGMDYEQLAGVIGQPIGTVRSRLHYAKIALRQALEKDG